MNHWLDYLFNLRNQGSLLGLERMRILSERLKNPERSFPIIHVAGTNGKGSVCSMLSSIYQSNDYNVGLFSSPHLIDLGERIQLNGENMSLDEMERMVDRIRPIAEEMEKEQEGMHPTFFEIMTAVAFLRFQERKVDLAILETGLGGRLDSTNVVTPELSIITSISLDHCEILGSRISEIAREKAGIIKKEKPILTGWLPEEAKNEIEQVAIRRKSEFFYLNIPNIECPKTNLIGDFQRRNAALAQKGVEILESEFPVSDKITAKAFKEVKLPGRWQVIQEKPKVVLDACHNVGGLECLKENLDQLEKPYTVWLSAIGQDRARDLMEFFLPIAEEVVFFTPNMPRACTYQEMISLTPMKFHSKCRQGNWEKIDLEYEKSINNPRQNLLVTGSIYLLGRLLSVLKKDGLNSSLSELQDHL